MRIRGNNQRSPVSVLKIPQREPRIIDICVEKSRRYWNSQTLRLRDRTKLIGQESRTFHESCKRLKRLAGLVRAGEDRLDRAIRNPRDIRACTYLWLEDDDFFRATEGVSRAALRRFKQIKHRLGAVSFYHLIQLFFMKFDDCGDLQALCDCIHAEFDRRSAVLLPESPARLKKNKLLIFSAEGYKRISQAADRQHRELYVLMKELGIEQIQDGRFIELAAACHFLAKINRLKADGDDSVLEQVVEPVVSEIRYEGRLLGHCIIERLAGLAYEQKIDIPERWLQTILSIAGDPRVQKSSVRYRKWWTEISSDTLSKIKERLGGFDLKLFLEALDDFANQSTDYNLRRMFPKRRIFLEGLLKQKLIRHTRLFIGRNADSYLRRKYGKEKLPSYALLNDSNKSIIYLQLDGSHVVEGSHMYRFWIYDKLPKYSPLINYDRCRFRSRELSLEMESSYCDEYFTNKFYRSPSEFPYYTSHNGFWQAKIIRKLYDMNILLDPEIVLDREDYRRFRSLHGVPSESWHSET